MYSCALRGGTADCQTEQPAVLASLRSVQERPLVRPYRSAGLKSKTDTLAAPRNCPGERPFLAHTGGFPFPAGDGTTELIFDGPALLGSFVPKEGKD